MNYVAQLARDLFFRPRRPRVATTLAVLCVFSISLIVGLDLARVDTTTIVETARPSGTTPPISQPLRPLEPGLEQGFSLVGDLSMDFNGTSLDASKWYIYNGAGNAGVGLRRPSAITVKDGALRITARGDVSGGLSQTRGQLYGRWVIRARMEKGAGYGPAILLWPDSEKWPEDGELDIVEMPNPNRTSAIMTTHWGKDNSQQSASLAGDYTEWHTFAVDWLPDRVVYYIDGAEQIRITNPAAIPTKPMHLAIQNDVGKCGSWIGCRDASTPETVTLYVSSVRVYSADGVTTTGQGNVH